MDGNVVSYCCIIDMLLSQDEQIVEQFFNYDANHGNQNYVFNVLNTKHSIIKSTPIQYAYKGRLNDNDESNLIQCIRLYNDVNLPYDSPKTNQLFPDPSYVKNKNDELFILLKIIKKTLNKI